MRFNQDFKVVWGGVSKEMMMLGFNLKEVMMIGGVDWKYLREDFEEEEEFLKNNKETARFYLKN